MSDNVSEDEVQHISDLALLNISDDDVPRFREQFNDILEKFSQLDEVDLEEVDLEEHNNVFREDDVEEGIDAREFIKEQEREESEYFEN